MDDRSHDNASWLKALRDPIGSRALTTPHAQPNAPWTIEMLAREVGYTSGFAFSRAFSRLRGSLPGRYRAEDTRRAARH
ncbi:MAG: hypothetical protein ABJB66_09075 [Gemmatimonadaceae bacterium]